MIFGTDYARAVEALKGKDAVTIQKEIFAAEVAKQKGTTPAEEYKWVSNGIDLGWLGEFEGWGRTIKGLPRGVSSNEKLPAVGKTEGYKDQFTKISNPHSPYLEIDKYGNEIYYRTLSKKDYEYLLDTGNIPATRETFVSPLSEYSKKYEGVLVRFYAKPGTSASLQEIGVTGNSATKREVFPDMDRAQKGWSTNNQALFKLEGRRHSPEINNGNGVVNTGLGKTEGLNKFNDNIIKFEK
ncbi:Uncharacterised protein [Actinobacillus equuli]|nr:Uncharacterised protein [Actinobacillus equuli]